MMLYTLLCCWLHARVMELLPLPVEGHPPGRCNLYTFICLTGARGVFNPGYAPSRCLEGLQNLSKATANISSLCLHWKKYFFLITANMCRELVVHQL